MNVIPEHFEQPQQNYPFPSPFILSSVERDWCGNECAKILFIKRRHLEENLKTIAGEIRMEEEEQKRFLDYWCQPCDNRMSMLLAERSGAFDIRYRAVSWMQKSGTRPFEQKKKSRIEKYAESARQFFGRCQEVPAGPFAAQGFGYADIPDEQ